MDLILDLLHRLLRDLFLLQNSIMTLQPLRRHHLTTKWHRISLQIPSRTFCQVAAITIVLHRVLPGPVETRLSLKILLAWDLQPVAVEDEEVPLLRIGILPS